MKHFTLDHAIEPGNERPRRSAQGTDAYGTITVMVNLPIEYSDKPVTHFGGMALMKRFLDQIGIREHLATLDLPQGGSNRAYDPVQIIESFWLGIWTGASRFIHCDWLRQDQTLAAIFGYEKLPSQSTYSRLFGRCSQARNTAVFPALQKWFFSQINVGAVTVDFDCIYIIAARAYSNLKNEIHGMKDWAEVCSGSAVKEWRHQPADPKAKARRHIVVRKQMSRRP